MFPQPAIRGYWEPDRGDLSVEPPTKPGPRKVFCHAMRALPEGCRMRCVDKCRKDAFGAF